MNNDMRDIIARAEKIRLLLFDVDGVLTDGSLFIDDDGNEYRYRIVGPDEFDYESNLISMDAPLAKGLMGKGVDDEVTIETPKGMVNYIVVDVSYEDPKKN